MFYPAGWTGGPDGVGKTWFQCAVCFGRGSARNYDLTRQDEKQIRSCGCVERACNAAYEQAEIEGMTPGARKNILDIYHRTRSASATAERTGCRKISVDGLIRQTYQRLEARFSLWKRQMIADAARLNYQGAMRIYKLTAAELFMVGNTVVKAARAARSAGQAAWERLSKAKQTAFFEVSRTARDFAEGLCSGNRTSPITRADLLGPKAHKKIAWFVDVLKDLPAAVIEIVMDGFGAKAAEIIRRSYKRNMRNRRTGMEKAASGIKRWLRRKKAAVDPSDYVPTMSRTEISMAMVTFAGAL
jgi:hypothetical protein